MTVEIVEPGAPVIISDRARQHFIDQSRRTGGAAVYLRLKESGCTGYMYDLDFVDGDPGGTVGLELAPGLLMYIDAASLPMLRGTDIDYVRNGLNSELQFRNPNAGDYCGCGESFSIAGSGG